MAGLGAEPGTTPVSEFNAKISLRQHFATIAWLRWRIFVNSLRGKGAVGELVVKILAYPFLALIILAPSVGAGFGSYYLVNEGEVHLLAIPLWIIFAVWQFIGVNTSATGPTFDLSSLIRFPIRYRDYLLIRLSFGLMDAPTLAGVGCLIGMSIGIAFAAPQLLPWAALLLFFYAVCNILFSRMIYTWVERWLAQRRTRELLTGLILAISIGIQFAAQFAQRLGHRDDLGHHAPSSPWMLKALHLVFSISRLLPPGLTASSIDHIHSGNPLIAVAALGGLLLYTAVFLLILHMRLYAQFRGEDLSEAPAAAKAKAKARTAPADHPAVKNKASATAIEPRVSASFSLLPATVAACLIKEVRYLLRSGPKLYALILPVFMVFVFSMRTSGVSYMGVPRPGSSGMLFSYGCAYTQLIFASMIYNSMGSDGAGVQFYFIAPLRMRDVILAKNLLTFAIFAMEATVIYIGSALISARAPADLTAATIAWSFFALFLNMSVGNVRSITAPRGVDLAKVRSQNVSGLSGLISLVVVVSCVGLGILTFILCSHLHASFWIAAAIFSVLAAIAFAIYIAVLGKLDGIANRHIEDLTRTLAKA